MNYLDLPKTALLDIDGCLVVYDHEVIACRKPMTVLPGVIEKLTEWKAKSYKIILTTGRGHERRDATIAQLKAAGLAHFYDELITGIGGGRRFLVNDIKPDGYIAATVHNLPRNAGISSIDE